MKIAAIFVNIHQQIVHMLLLMYTSNIDKVNADSKNSGEKALMNE